MKKSKVYAGLLTAILSIPLSGCGKNVDCDISGKHIHVYQNEEGINRLVMGEKEKYLGYNWTSDYVEENDTNKVIAKEGMLSIYDNINHVLDNVNKLPESYREEWVYDYIYGSHYGYGYCYHFDGEDWSYGYGYGNITDWHWDYVWKKIDENTYTSNKVKDIKSMFKLYKLTSGGEFVYKYFSSFDEIEEGYIYFKYGQLIVQTESEEYYLNPVDFQNNSLTK